MVELRVTLSEGHDFVLTRRCLRRCVVHLITVRCGLGINDRQDGLVVGPLEEGSLEVSSFLTVSVRVRRTDGQDGRHVVAVSRNDAQVQGDCTTVDLLSSVRRGVALKV